MDDSTGSRIRSSVFDPPGKIGDDVIRQLAFWRHLQRFMFHRLKQQTVGRVLRHQRRARIASGQNTFTRVQDEPTLDRFGIGGMAGVTVFDQNRTNPFFKEFQLSRVRSNGRLRLSFVHCLRGKRDNANRKQHQAAIHHIATETSFHADYFPVRVGQDWAERCETWNFRLCSVGQWLQMLSRNCSVSSRTQQKSALPSAKFSRFFAN